MSAWVITSWVFVALLTGVNIFIFLKLKSASEQMMKMAFPNAKNLQDAVGQMQGMMGGMGKGGARPMNSFTGMPMPGPRGKGGGGGNDAQLKAAMQMLQNMQKNGKK